MTKGKYAARAANRMTNLDNDLLQQERAKNAELEREIADLKQQLQVALAPVQADIQQRADALAAEKVAVAHEQVRQVTTETTAAKERIAEWLVQFLHHLCEKYPDTKVIPGDFTEVITVLVGNERAGEYTDRILQPAANWISNRRTRRLTGEKLRENRAHTARKDYRRNVIRDAHEKREREQEA